jgi:hypothetical protein
MEVHTPPCRTMERHVALLADLSWPSPSVYEQLRDEREEEMRLAAIEDARDQVPTEMADWPAGNELELRALWGDR